MFQTIVARNLSLQKAIWGFMEIAERCQNDPEPGQLTRSRPVRTIIHGPNLIMEYQYAPPGQEFDWVRVIYTSYYDNAEIVVQFGSRQIDVAKYAKQAIPHSDWIQEDLEHRSSSYPGGLWKNEAPALV